MSSVRSNFAANLAGQTWVALVQLAAVPLYLSLLGIEAYGLIGFFVALQATLQVLDLGLGQALMREIAARRAHAGGLADARNLVTTVSIAYAALSVGLGLAVAFAAPFVASDVIKASELDRQSIEQAIILMGLLIPVLWGINLIQSILIGMEKHVLMNGIRMASAAVAAGGAVMVLWLVSPTITAFFKWQLIAGIATWIVAGWIVHRALPPGPSSFSPALLKSLWRFAAGMSAVGAGGVVLMQMDKWILINLLALESYGHYVLAWVLANALYLVIAPVFTSVYPRMTTLYSIGDQHGLGRLYHSSAQYVAVLALPLAAALSLFAEEILLIWTRDPAIARGAASVAAILIWGTALNGLMNIPYALQLAAGRAGLALKLVVLKLLLFAPAIVLLTLEYGPMGAALAWLLLNAIYVAVGIPATHAALLRGHGAAWLTKDILPPAVAVGVTSAIAAALRPSGAEILVNLIFIAATTLLVMLAAFLAASEPRAWLISLARRVRPIPS